MSQFILRNPSDMGIHSGDRVVGVEKTLFQRCALFPARVQWPGMVCRFCGFHFAVQFGTRTSAGLSEPDVIANRLRKNLTFGRNVVFMPSFLFSFNRFAFFYDPLILLYAGSISFFAVI